MEVIVDKQPQRFWLALDGEWTPAVGHGVRVGEMNFCITMHENVVNVSEITTGCRVTKRELNLMDIFNLSEKEAVLTYFKKIGNELADYFSKNDVFEQQTTKYRNIVLERLGPMPTIEYVSEEELMKYELSEWEDAE